MKDTRVLNRFFRRPRDPWWPFLLGELPADERERVEARLIEDADLFEEVVAAEHDLLDAYAANRLPRSQRERVERFLQTSQASAARADFAAALRSRLADHKAGGKSEQSFGIMQFALAAASVATIGVAVWAGWRTTVLNDQLVAERSARAAERSTLEARAAEASRRAADLQRQVEEGRATPATPLPPDRQADTPSRGLVAFSLIAGLRGDDAAPRLVVPPRTEAIELELDTETVPRGRPLRAVLRGESGAQVFSSSVTLTDQNPLTITVPGRLLRDGRYELTLDDTEKPVASYAFAIARRPL